MLIVWFFVYKKLAQFAVRCALPPRKSESPVCATDNKPSCMLHLLGWFIGSRGFSSLERRPEFWVLQFQDDSAASHLLWTLFLILLHQLHLRSPGIRSQRLGTLNLGYKMKLNWMVKQKQGQSQRMNQSHPQTAITTGWEPGMSRRSQPAGESPLCADGQGQEVMRPKAETEAGSLASFYPYLFIQSLQGALPPSTGSA